MGKMAPLGPGPGPGLGPGPGPGPGGPWGALGGPGGALGGPGGPWALALAWAWPWACFLVYKCPCGGLPQAVFTLVA